MKKKLYIILLIILAIAVAVLVGVVFGKKANEQREQEAEEANTVYVNQFDVSDVTAFSYLIDNQVAMFSLEDGVWSYMSDTSWTLDTEKVEDFLTQMSEVTANTVIEDAEDTSQYGIDQPTQMFAVVFSDGSSLTYLFGSENDVVGGTYLQFTDDADDTNNQNIYLVDSSVVSSDLSRSAESFQVDEDGDSVSE